MNVGTCGVDIAFNAIETFSIRCPGEILEEKEILPLTDLANRSISSKVGTLWSSIINRSTVQPIK